MLKGSDSWCVDSSVEGQECSKGLNTCSCKWKKHLNMCFSQSAIKMVHAGMTFETSGSGWMDVVNIAKTWQVPWRELVELRVVKRECLRNCCSLLLYRESVTTDQIESLGNESAVGQAGFLLMGSNGPQLWTSLHSKFRVQGLAREKQWLDLLQLKLQHLKTAEQVGMTAIQGTDSSPSLSLRYFSISLVAFLIAPGLYLFLDLLLTYLSS